MLSYKKYLAAALAATMVVGSSTVAFAATSPSNFEMSGSDVKTEDASTPDEASGSHTGTGNIEGIVNKEVFKVEVPTIPEDSTIFDFTLDPQGLIEATNADKYTDANPNVKFASGTTLYFKNDIDKNANGDDYSNTSDYIVLKNKSTTPIDVSVDAKVTDLGALKLTADNTFANDTDTSIYLALVDKEATPNEVAIDETDGASIGKEDIAAASNASDDLYIATYDKAAGKYVYDIDTTKIAGATIEEYAFALTGASNADGNWSDLTEEEIAATQPKVEVVWNVATHVDPVAPTAPTGATFTVPANAQDAVLVPMSMGAGSAAATTVTITYTNSSGNAATLGDAYYEVLADSLRIRPSYLRDSYANFAGNGREFTVTLGFADDSITPVTGTFTLVQE